MTLEKVDCERCNATIMLSPSGPFQQDFILRFTVPAEEEGVFETHERILCDSCHLKLLHWIDDPDEDNSDRIQLPKKIHTAKTLKHVSKDLENIANKLENELN